MSNFAATTIRAVLERLGDPNHPANALGMFQIKNLLGKYNDMKPASWVLNQGDANSRAIIDNLLAQKQTAFQATSIDLWNAPAGGATTNLTLTGFQTGSTVRQPVTLDTLISRKLTFDFSNLVRWDSAMTTNEKVEAEIVYLLRDAYFQILQQYNTQFLAYLSANTAAGGGLGTVFPTSGVNPSYKSIPNTEPNVFNGIYVDGVIGNRFQAVRTGATTTLIGSSNLWGEVASIEQFGVQNARDAARQLPLFEFLPTDSMAPLTNASTWRAFLIDKDTVIGTTWVPPLDMSLPLGLGDFGNKEFMTFEMPAPAVGMGLPSLKLGLYVEKNFTDQFLTFSPAVEEDRLNRTTNMILYCYPVFHQSLNNTAFSNNIVAYEKLV